MNVVILGGAGQIGTLVLARFAAERKVRRVVCLDREPPLFSSAKIEHRALEPNDVAVAALLAGADAAVDLGAADAPFESLPARRLVDAAVGQGVRAVVRVSSLLFDRDGDAESVFAEPGAEVRRIWLRTGFAVGRRMSRAAAFDAFAGGPIPVIWDEDVADAVHRAVLGEAAGAFSLLAEPPIGPETLSEHRRFRALVRGGELEARLRRLRRRDGRPAVARASAELSSERARAVLGWKPRCPTALDVIHRAEQTIPRRLDPRLGLFFRLIDLLGRRARLADLPAEARRMNLTVHLDVTGPRGGDFVLEIREGRPRLRPGVARPPDGTMTLASETLLALLAGDDDLSRARMAARVRASGEPNAVFALAGMIQGFRNATAKPGATGAVSNRLSRWFSRGGRRGRT